MNWGHFWLWFVQGNLAAFAVFIWVALITSFIKGGSSQ